MPWRNMSQTQPKTKLVNIELAGLTRVCWGATVEVPADISKDDLDLLVEKFYDQTDGGEFHDDPEYWEKGECYWGEVYEDQETPTFRVDEDLEITPIGEPDESD